MSPNGTGGPGGFENVPLPGMPPTPQPGAGARQPAAGGGVGLPDTGSSGAQLPHLDEGERGSTELRERMFAFVTGRQASGALEGDRRAQLIAAFGASARDPARPDVAAAAKGLKVSPRSVQRWVAGGGMSPRHAATLRTRARQAMTTKRGRAAAARAAGPPRPPPGRNAIQVGGVQGVISGETGNYRARTTQVQITAEDMDLMRQLWVEHGDNGMEAFLHQHFDQHYQAGWHFRSIEEISWGSSTNY